jgi:hypothetical protein
MGPGLTSARASSGPTNVKLSGGGVGFRAAVGGAILENLILFGELVLDSALSPDLEVGGMLTGTFNDGSADIGGVGGGAAYYIMPINVYLAAALVASRFTLHDSGNGQVGATHLGLGFDFTVGKEWFVSDNWGLGIAGQLLLASMKDKVELPGAGRPYWKGVGLSIAFSATFN